MIEKFILDITAQRGGWRFHESAIKIVREQLDGKTVFKIHGDLPPQSLGTVERCHLLKNGNISIFVNTNQKHPSSKIGLLGEVTKKNGQIIYDFKVKGLVLYKE